MKLYASYTVANASIHDERVFSAYLSIPKTFNTIDEDYRKIDEDTICEDVEEPKVEELSEVEAVTENIQVEIVDEK